MKILARDRFTDDNVEYEVAVYRDGVGIRQTAKFPFKNDPQDVSLGFDQIERIARLVRKHRKQVEKLAAEDDRLLTEP